MVTRIPMMEHGLMVCPFCFLYLFIDIVQAFFSYNKYIKLQHLRAQIMTFVSQCTSRDAVVADCLTAGMSASLWVKLRM